MAVIWRRPEVYIFITGLVMGLSWLGYFFEPPLITEWVGLFQTWATGIAQFALALGFLSADIVKQILASVEAPLGGAPMDWFNFLWTSLGFVLITSYFTFTKEHTGWYFYPTKIGRYILMLGLGVYFGNTVQFRMAMLGGRVQYLLQVFKIIPWP
ncbi:MAG: hypothetical protein NDF54_01230 [archaeon GB-1867-035]|nr:hypothetical protein [Candidatus Culexmicrobium profundum]